MPTPQPNPDAETRAGAGARSEPLEHLAALQALVLAAQTFTQAAAAFVAELGERFGFDRVSLGFGRADRIALAAISHSRPGASTRVDRELVGALEETLANGTCVCVCEHVPAAGMTIAHTSLVHRLGGSACSVPLLHAGFAVGAVCLERRGPPPPPDEIRRLAHLLWLLTPVLYLRWLDEQPLAVRIARQFRQGAAPADSRVAAPADGRAPPA